MHTNYDAALRHVLKLEGGYVNHPDDPGGATNQGVTQKVYDAYRKSFNMAVRSVREITTQEVASIYRRQYADKVKFNDLPAGLDLVLFDGAVNSGPVQSIKWLQRALGVKADGLLGEVTLEAAKAASDHDALIARILELRLGMLKSLKHWKTFKKGWTSRIEHVREVGQAWATGSVGPQPVHIDGAAAKAEVTEQAKAPSQLVGAATIAIGAVLPQLQQEVVQLQNELIAHQVVLPFLEPVIAHLKTAGAALAVTGILYTVFANVRQRFLAAAAS